MNLKEFGWDGYDMDMFNVPGNDPSATGESPFDTLMDQNLYSIPYQDPLDGSQHDVEDFLW